MWLAGRVGVDLSEDCVGTTAPGMVALSGRGCTVQGAEHYFQVNHGLQCAAAPIRDQRGELVAVLDLSCEARDFQFDAAALAHLYATSIENRLLTRQSKPQVLLRFQASAQLLHTPLEGLAAVDDSGQLLWMNAAGRSLLQAPQSGREHISVEQAFGLTLAQLVTAARADTLLMHRLPNGLQLCLQAQTEQRRTHAALSLPTPAAAPSAEPPPTPAAARPDDGARLREASQQSDREDAGRLRRQRVTRSARAGGVAWPDLPPHPASAQERLTRREFSAPSSPTAAPVPGRPAGRPRLPGRARSAPACRARPSRARIDRQVVGHHQAHRPGPGVAELEQLQRIDEGIAPWHGS